jgi:uncharacterized membrane protein YdjX (TVP38/TMEM64 family)
MEADITTGALWGALAGSVVPIVGTVGGAILGGAFMYFKGKRVGEKEAMLNFYRLENEPKSRKTRSK